MHPGMPGAERLGVGKLTGVGEVGVGEYLAGCGGGLGVEVKVKNYRKRPLL